MSIFDFRKSYLCFSLLVGCRGPGAIDAFLRVRRLARGSACPFPDHGPNAYRLFERRAFENLPFDVDNPPI
jgi:hypothetical protein